MKRFITSLMCVSLILNSLGTTTSAASAFSTPLAMLKNETLTNNILIIIIIILLAIFLVMQIIFNQRLRKSKWDIKMEKECYQSLFELTSDVFWEYSIKEDVFTQSDPDLGIRTGLATTPNYGEFMLTHKIVYEEDLPIFNAFYEDMKNGTKKMNYEFRAKTIAGTFEWFEVNATTIYDENDEPVLVLGQTTNIHERKQIISNLTESIENDKMTKVYNKTTLATKVNDSIQEYNDDTLCAFFLIDIDNFEDINNKYGYVFGDALLLEIATKLKMNYEHSDAMIGRMGGDEFAIFLPCLTSALHAEKEALCILTIIDDMLVKQENSNTLTATLGITLEQTRNSTFEDLLCKSDTALYYSKTIATENYLFYDEQTMSPAGYIDRKASIEDDAFMNKVYNYSLIDSELIAHAVEILSDAREIQSSINMILGIIGTFYNLSYIGIIENNELSREGMISHEWRMNSAMPWNSNIKISEADMTRLSKYNHMNCNYLATSEINSLRTMSEALYEAVLDAGITGILECDIYEHRNTNCYILYCFNTPDRLWEQHEIDTLLLLAKILEGYLSNLKAQRRAEWLQRTDSLTGSNNLTTFHEEALRIVKKNPNNKYVIFYSDIDKFKLINENYGYDEGNRILMEFANAMRSITDSDETFGRIVDDKFVGLFRFDRPKHFLSKIKALNDYMNMIPCSANSTYRIPIIIGLCPLDNYNRMSVNIDQANIARKSITNRHKSRYIFFNKVMKMKLINQHEIEDQMELALQNDNFKVYYQPKYNLETNGINGAEALVRWQHPTKGLIFPNDFIPIFEENQFILKLDFYVFEQACKHIRKLIDHGKEVHPVSVNFSRLHLNNNSIIEKLQTIIDKYDVPANYLEIELTESALQGNNSNMFSILISLHKKGFQISMDDFGSGLSSLNLLRTLPCDIIKLDKEFFQQGTSTERERIVITMIVKMAHELHMKIVSEGVETEEQADFLRSIHCDLAQGYLYSKPIPEEEFERIYYQIED